MCSWPSLEQRLSPCSYSVRSWMHSADSPATLAAIFVVVQLKLLLSCADADKLTGPQMPVSLHLVGVIL